MENKNLIENLSKNKESMEKSMEKEMRSEFENMLAKGKTTAEQSRFLEAVKKLRKIDVRSILMGKFENDNLAKGIGREYNDLVDFLEMPFIKDGFGEDHEKRVKFREKIKEDLYENFKGKTEEESDEADEMVHEIVHPFFKNDKMRNSSFSGLGSSIENIVRRLSYKDEYVGIADKINNLMDERVGKEWKDKGFVENPSDYFGEDRIKMINHIEDVVLEVVEIVKDFVESEKSK